MLLLLVCPQVEAARDAQSTGELKQLSMEELLNVKVISVSRRPEKLSEAASAIQVISADDIRRSGATSLPEALRLATNLQVAQIDARQWAISARGFNNSTANKLLVLIDGRVVYTPLYAGVFWDVQDTLLEDIDRIEVVSGPGATLWGGNAVNGVINILTRRAKDSRGALLVAGAGSELRKAVAMRAGTELQPGLDLRVYGKANQRDDAELGSGSDGGDAWTMAQGGFRLGWESTRADLLTLQGDIYSGRADQAPGDDVDISGGNLLGRWTHRYSVRSDSQLQLYFDRSHRRLPGTFQEDLDTVALEFQHHLALGERQEIVWGLGYRHTDDEVDNSAVLAFLPAAVRQDWYQGFVQDEITLVEDRLRLTLGSKAERGPYGDHELEPSGRLSWSLNEDHMLWTAISRAVRMPSRIDHDLHVPGSAPYLLAGGAGFEPEKLLAYELGYRGRPGARLNLAVSTFYNDYDDIRSLEPSAPPAPFPLVVANGQRATSYGAEVRADCQVLENWWLHAGYTGMQLDFQAKPGSMDTSGGTTEARDPRHQLSLRSTLTLRERWDLDGMMRWTSRVENGGAPAYAELDLRLGWRPAGRSLELSLVGRNLLHSRHVEFSVPAPGQSREIERSVFGKLTWRP